MSQTNDCMYAALVAQGIPPTDINEMLLSWTRIGGATADVLNEALLQRLKNNGATSDTLNGAWYEVLVLLGITPGSRSDMAHEFWCDLEGRLGVRIEGGWTGIEMCATAASVVTHLAVDITFGGLLVTHNP